MHTTHCHTEHHKMRTPCRKSLILAATQLQTCSEETHILDLDRCRELRSLNLKTNKQNDHKTNKKIPPLRTSDLFLKSTGKFFRTLNNRFSLYPAFCCIPQRKGFLQHARSATQLEMVTETSFLGMCQAPEPSAEQ